MRAYSIPTCDGGLGKNRGCERAPAALSAKLKIESEIFSLTQGDIEKQHEEIQEQAIEAFKGKEIPFFIGGTHDITFPLFRAFAKTHKNPSLLIFDAHVDSDQGTSVPTHEDFVRALVEQKIIPAEKIMVVGVRQTYPSEQDFLVQSGIRFILSEVVHSNFSDVEKLVKNFASKAGSLYVSFDVDCLSNRIMLATHYTPRGGLLEKEARLLLHATIKHAKALDLVEFNPTKITLKEDDLLQELFQSLI